jgi:hypothetical protein
LKSNILKKKDHSCNAFRLDIRTNKIYRCNLSHNALQNAVAFGATMCKYSFNRYVDGLATWQPQDPDVYREIGQHTARLGYVGRDYKKPLEAIAAKQGSSGTKAAGS